MSIKLPSVPLKCNIAFLVMKIDNSLHILQRSFIKTEALRVIQREVDQCSIKWRFNRFKPLSLIVIVI